MAEDAGASEAATSSAAPGSSTTVDADGDTILLQGPLYKRPSDGKVGRTLLRWILLTRNDRDDSDSGTITLKWYDGDFFGGASNPLAKLAAHFKPSGFAGSRIPGPYGNPRERGTLKGSLVLTGGTVLERDERTLSLISPDAKWEGLDLKGSMIVFEDPNIYILDRWYRALKAEIDALAQRSTREQQAEAQEAEQLAPGSA